MVPNYTFLRIFAVRDGQTARRLAGEHSATDVARWAGEAAEQHVIAQNDANIGDTGGVYEIARLEALDRIDYAITYGKTRFLVYRDDATSYYAEVA